MPDSTPIVPVILSGGSGTRLWPESRPERPKQLLALTADETMLQLTARRTGGRERFGRPIVVANAAHADMVEEQLGHVGEDAQALILEPAGRNTAPAIALAALAANGSDPLLVMPSDHVITDVDAFHQAIQSALPLVEQGWLVTFGITPDAPEIGYGWIKVGDAIAAGVHRVDRFVEKPPRDKAEAMLASGDHAWNGGIFLFRADAFLSALEQHAPAIVAAARASMASARRDGTRIHPDADLFAASPSDSIDYAVMEKADRVAVVPVAMGWSDVGSWDALHTISACDGENNVCSGDVVMVDAANCLVRAGAGKRIALVGVEDLIVVAHGDDILVLPRGRSQDVKKLIEAMKR
ncbi:mannose-1-phosphate guanylyltransferase/mannose-6-phosphate isomerase [Sphingomonas sp. HF-S3]|uniref:Mannose-1-phosphate guanylyltransferase/mannose-6-phosphate isomerase n=1 Tax=Sphingomonas rustica TaxID=3103142 RepID=A0ABV0B838_9SPHN